MIEKSLIDLEANNFVLFPDKATLDQIRAMAECQVVFLLLNLMLFLASQIISIMFTIVALMTSLR
jgi:hypothetical protein